MLKLIKRKHNLSIRDFYNRRNKVLIRRTLGGFGDILMQRMMFEDFSKIDVEIHYACPHEFMEMSLNHPFLKNIKEINKVSLIDYGIIYDITTICAITESKELSNNKRHRSDIWANHCGVELTKHEMHLYPEIEQIENCKRLIKEINPNGKTVVLLATRSVDNDFAIAKSLTETQIEKLVSSIIENDMIPITVHKNHQDIYNRLNVKQFVSLHPQTWIALVACSDIIVSIDTATFHIAGGLKKPLVGIFSFTDGKVYGKYYKFLLVQKHRDNGDWDCGPCFNCHACPKEKVLKQKPCLTEIDPSDIMDAILSLKNNLHLEKY